jgi:osmotically-inducible protein OsmY
MALLAAEGVPGSRIHVDTTDGRVTLFGSVASAAERAKAEEVAGGIDGARAVRNLIAVAEVPERADVPDAELRQAVDRALDGDAALAGAKIEVRSVESGVVTLAGRADTLSEHRRAIDTAADVPGVKRVESEVQAPDTLTDAEMGRDEPYDAAAYAKAAAADAWITTATKTRLLADPKTPGFEINVDSDDGVVTLFGSVDSAATKQHAEAEARKVAGVRAVKNALQVVPPQSQPTTARVDAELADEIGKRIEAHDRLADDDISVQVEKSVARLSGTIDGAGDRLAALTAARGVAGVTSVIDDLRVSDEPPAVGSR